MNPKKLQNRNLCFPPHNMGFEKSNPKKVSPYHHVVVPDNETKNGPLKGERENAKLNGSRNILHGL